MKRTVLVLEQDPETCIDLRTWLEQFNFQVVCAGRCDDALLWATILEPTAVIINIKPSGGCGIELAGTLRSRGFGDIPMIAISDSRAMLQVASLYDYFSAYLEKPLNSAQLVDDFMRLIRTDR